MFEDDVRNHKVKFQKSYESIRGKYEFFYAPYDIEI